MNTDMLYRVASMKDDHGDENVFVYAADREDALKSVPGLFASALEPLGEVNGM